MKLFIIYLLIIQITIKLNKSTCGSYIPRTVGTCDQFTEPGSDYICCHLQGNYDGNYFSKCYSIAWVDYYKLARSTILNGFEYTLDCGKRRGAFCGDVVNPVNYQDCGIYSTSGNSCCYYNYKGKTNCVWLGTSDIGSYSNDDLTVICSMTFPEINFLIYAMIIIFLL